MHRGGGAIDCEEDQEREEKLGIRPPHPELIPEYASEEGSYYYIFVDEPLYLHIYVCVNIRVNSMYICILKRK